MFESMCFEVEFYIKSLHEEVKFSDISRELKLLVNHPGFVAIDNIEYMLVEGDGERRRKNTKTGNIYVVNAHLYTTAASLPKYWGKLDWDEFNKMITAETLLMEVHAALNAGTKMLADARQNKLVERDSPAMELLSDTFRVFSHSRFRDSVDAIIKQQQARQVSMSVLR